MGSYKDGLPKRYGREIYEGLVESGLGADNSQPLTKEEQERLAGETGVKFVMRPRPEDLADPDKVARVLGVDLGEGDRSATHVMVAGKIIALVEAGGVSEHDIVEILKETYR